ncbi:hypothetical protein [Flavobacterium sp.]|uniref:hypothetical protein n=1 Tax=Flavobacterium sp. TaxID=239 RepID=UPI0031DE9FF2
MKEINIHPDLKICYSCFSLYKLKTDEVFNCPICHREQNLNQYIDYLDNSKKTVRYGYQYRDQYEKDFLNDPKLNLRYNLLELNDIYSFIALAILNTFIGNIAWEGVKALIQKIKNDPLIIEIEDDEFKKFLEDEKEQEKFVRYIEEFRNSKMNTNPKVLEAITEEIDCDEKAEKFMQTRRIKELIAKLEKIQKSSKIKSKKGKKK